MLQLLVVNRLIDPGSEFRLHRQWFDQSAMDVLLDADFSVAEKDRLYRCLDRILEHKRGSVRLFAGSDGRICSMPQFEVLLYDLTSTYVEGEAEQNPKAKRGYSRDGRPDCKQVVIALVITPEGFPLAYEVMDGNTSDRTTLRDFLKKIEDTVWEGRARLGDGPRHSDRRGAGGDASPRRQMFYLVGTPAGKIDSTKNNGWICPGRKCATRWK